jgi:hypothetical protein
VAAALQAPVDLDGRQMTLAEYLESVALSRGPAQARRTTDGLRVAEPDPYDCGCGCGHGVGYGVGYGHGVGHGVGHGHPGNLPIKASTLETRLGRQLAPAISPDIPLPGHFLKQRR